MFFLNTHDLKLIQDLQIPIPVEDLAMLKRELLFRSYNVYAPIKPSLQDKIQPVIARTSDGMELNCWYIPPKQKGGMTILFCHGNMYPISLLQDVAENMAGLNDEFGIGALMLEYRGYGENRDLGVFKEKEDIFKDAESAMKFINQQGTPDSNIVVWGLSMGGSPAGEMAARHKEVKGLVLESTFTDNNQLFANKQFLTFLKKAGKISEREDRLLIKSPHVDKILNFLSKSEFFNYRTAERLAETKGIPTLIIHSGENDIIVPQSMAEGLAAASPNRKGVISPDSLKEGAVTELHISKDGSHRYMGESSKARVTNFFSSLL
ncbi:MAG: alpha/beta fold hydrolase [Candidatus Gastranaerophilaceae bacterium]|jgi:alpha-beta hydrolase superfamily lysophospholipase